jgi:hypothetical protein
MAKIVTNGRIIIKNSFYDESEIETETTSLEYVCKLELSTAIMGDGYHSIFWYAEALQDQSDAYVGVRFSADGYNYGEVQIPGSNVGPATFSGLKRADFTGTNHAFKLCFKSSESSGTATIKNARIEVEKLGDSGHSHG